MCESRPDASEDLVRECSRFCHYLVGRPPSPYVLGKYRAGHRSRGFAAGASTAPFDLLLVRIARHGGVATRLVDAYSRLLRPRSLLRRKLGLLLAILECSPETRATFESPERLSLGRFALGLLPQLAGLGLGLAVAVPLLFPLQLALGRADRPLPMRGHAAVPGADRA